jgi:hypothetical protein
VLGIIQAFSCPSGDDFRNTMYFSRGELVFNSNFKNEYPDRRSGLNATEVTSYQYLGSSVDIKGIFGFKCRRISLPILFNFIEVTSRLKVLVILKEDLPLSLFLRKLDDKQTTVPYYDFTRALPTNLHLRYRQQPNQPLTPSK